MTYETVIEKTSRVEYEVLCDKSGENPQPCPICSPDRKKKTAKVFSYNSQKGVGKCQHCGADFYKKSENDHKSFVRPLWENITNLSEKVVEWFLGRNIGQETLISMRVTDGVEWMPHKQAEMNVIKFNYFRDGNLINVKYRSGDKGFKLVKDAEKIFYNLDGIKGKKEIYIVEGEMDCLTFVQNGITNCISVPNGATKGQNNLSYLDNSWEYFEGAEKVYIATDHDENGDNLANELARRIGVEKCFRMDLLPFKDANEQYCKTGKLDLTKFKPFPITGVYSISDHWDDFLNLLKNGFPVGWKPRGKLGEHISFHPGYTSIITGIPGHGKSEVLDQILIQLSIDYNLRGGFFTPENWPTELHIIKLTEKLLGKSAFKANGMELTKAKEFMTDKFYWIYPDEGYKLETVLDKIRQAVLKYGINWYVIDPWNKLEHHDDSTNYVSRCLDLISNFNKKNGTHAFIVAHPTKMKFNREEGKYDVPGLYDISGSANFFNKADIGLSMYREQEQHRNSLYIQKVKFKFWGAPGKIEYNWDQANGRYTEFGNDPTNWIKQTAPQELMTFSEPKFADQVPF
jgi:twinkle protein